MIDQNTGAMAPVGAPRNNCPLPAALRLRSGDQPERHAPGDADLSTSVWARLAGIAPGSVRARTTLDNVGVQYGLKALLSGAISAEEFVTLNEKIGGFDADVNCTAAPHWSPTRRRCRSGTARHRRAARTLASRRSSTCAASTSRASTTSGACSERMRIDAAYGDHDNQ